MWQPPDRDQYLVIVVAHKWEAEPVSKILGMQYAGVLAGLKCYSDGGSTILTVCGIGKNSASSAVDKLARCLTERPVALSWLNMGICGHASHSLGSGFLANRVRCRQSGEVLYPSQFFYGLESSGVETVAEPELAYPDDVLYDMEAQGFLSAALAHSPAELVSVYKIVSDNLANPPGQVTAQFVESIMGQRGDEVRLLAEKALDLAAEFAPQVCDPAGFTLLRNRHRFTRTETHQLRELLLKAQCIGLELPQALQSLPESQKGKCLDLLRCLVKETGA